jgi:hypothetical protein
MTDEQHEAIHRMQHDGLGVHEIATACYLAVEQVRAVLFEPSKVFDPISERMAYEDWLAEMGANEM